MKPRIPLSLTHCLLALLCAGCVSKPLQTPAFDLPRKFEYTSDEAASPTSAWLRQFGSAELNDMLQAADANNLDLAAAIARVQQADARLRMSQAALLPQVEAGVNAVHIAGRTGSASARETDWSALVSASYELDFWGKNRSARDSLVASGNVSRADLSTLRITILTGVANAYFQVLSLRERMAIAKSSLDSADQVLAFIHSRYREGMATPTEVAAQAALVANARIVIPQLQTQEVETRAALAVLLGLAPEMFVVTMQSLGAIKEPAIAAGLPSQLLQRRPDVRAAESSLQAAHADLNVARANLFPALSLTASGALQNPAVQAAVQTLEGTGFSLNLSGALLQSVFDGGRRRAVIRESAAREQELIANYRSAILSALRDVEVALFARHALDLQRTAQHDNVAQNELAAQGALSRYREGAAEYLAVLESQRSLYAAQDQRSQYELARLQASLSLAKALGGGWH